jgi:hypothetical protein
MPDPTSVDGKPILLAVCASRAHNSYDRAPVAWAISAAIPAVCGVAMLVPLIRRLRNGIGQLE